MSAIKNGAAKIAAASLVASWRGRNEGGANDGAWRLAA